VFDLIKETYSEITTKEYDRLTEFLNLLWENVKKILRISATEESKIILDLFEKFYHPKKLPTTKLKILEQLPVKKFYIKNTSISNADLDKLKENQIYQSISRGDDEYLIITPEGYGFFVALKNSKQYDNKFRLNSWIIKNYEKFISNIYREITFEKILKLETKKDGKIGLKEVAIILFFLINGSINKDAAFHRENTELDRAINSIVQAFLQNKNFSDSDRYNEKIVPLRILHRDIPTLNEQMGYPIYNNKGKYYIKSEMEKERIVKRIKTAIRQIQKPAEIWERWHAFKKEYEHWRYILRQNSVCFYDQKNEFMIENEILPPSRGSV